MIPQKVKPPHQNREGGHFLQQGVFKVALHSFLSCSDVKGQGEGTDNFVTIMVEPTGFKSVKIGV